MGAYKKESIEKDFMVSANNMALDSVKILSLFAETLIEKAPDNEARDFAISHLLQAAGMISACYMLDAKTRKGA